MILAEAFLENGYGVSDLQRNHAQRRSLRVMSGGTYAYVSITLAVFNVGTCRYLTEDKKCGIYDHRPLVCRIYPIEINPHIQLRPEFKDCAPETWDGSGPLIYRDGRLVHAELAALIEKSRQADRDEIGIKAEICRRLGINVTALKGDGFASYLPDTDLLLSTMRDVLREASEPLWEPQDWSLRVSRPELADRLIEMDADIAQAMPVAGTFIPLG